MDSIDHDYDEWLDEQERQPRYHTSTASLVQRVASEIPGARVMPGNILFVGDYYFYFDDLTITVYCSILGEIREMGVKTCHAFPHMKNAVKKMIKMSFTQIEKYLK